MTVVYYCFQKLRTCSLHDTKFRTRITDNCHYVEDKIATSNMQP